MIEKFKEAMGKGHEFGAFLTVLSKAFDIVGHKPLHAKLYSYGISLSSINLLSYLNNRTKRIKIKDFQFKTWNWIWCATILGPLLFNIDLINLFFT